MKTNDKIITISANETFSFADFQEKLEVKTGDVIIYYDYYALKRPDLVEKLLDSFDIPKKIIVSQAFSIEGIAEHYKEQSKRDYERCCNKFKIFTLDENDKKRLHNTYLIIRKEDKWHILNGSNSLNGYIGKEDRGGSTYKTKASVLYAYVNENMFSKNIIDFLNKLANE